MEKIIAEVDMLLEGVQREFTVWTKEKNLGKREATYLLRITGDINMARAQVQSLLYSEKKKGSGNV